MEKRKQLDNFFMKIAEKFAERSHCQRLKVGAVITKNDRIVSTGWNGTPSGFINCDDVDFEDIQKQHHLFSDQFEIHAEMNAIMDMARRGLSMEGCTLYTTICPCKYCAKLVVSSGISRVVFRNFYDRDVPEKDFATLFEGYNGKDILTILDKKINIEQI